MTNSKDGSGRALARIGASALASSAPTVANLVGAARNIPLAGDMVSLLVVGVVLGRQTFNHIQDRRTRAAIARIFNDDDWAEYYKRRFKAKDGEAWKRQVLSCLDNLSRSTADEAVEPLIRLSKLVAQDRLAWSEARGVVATLQALTGVEIIALGRVIGLGLQAMPNVEALDFFERRKGDHWVWCVAVKGKTDVELEAIDNGAEAFGVLATHNVCHRSRPFKVGGSSTDESDRFAMRHDQLVLFDELLNR